MKTKSPAVRIEPAIMEQLHNAFPDFTDSIIIQSAINYALICCCIPDSKRKIKKKKIRKRAQEIRSSGKNISYRIFDKTLHKLELYYADKNEKLKKTQVIKCCLSEVLCLLEQFNNSKIESLMYQISNEKKEKNLLDLLIKLDQEKYTIRELSKSENIAYRSGIKSYDILELVSDTIDKITDKYTITDYVEPFMGTGNVLFHVKPFPYEEINDLSESIVHILNILKIYPVEFITRFSSLDVDEATFSKQQEFLQYINSKYEKKRNKNKLNKIRNKNESIDKAVADYYILLFSVRGDCTCFDKSATNKTLLNKLNILQQVGVRLQNTKISNKDAFDLLRELAESTDDKLAQTLIYFDPPYIGTEDYYKVSENNETDFHEKLRDEIITLKDRGAKIIISYRATVTLHNKTTNNIGVQNKLDKLYMNQGFFMQPKRIKHYTKIKNESVPDDQIEILLTSVQVRKSVPYDSNIADLIKELAK